MKTLTIFTPAYNRAHTLVRTFQSLCRQTCCDFDWLIIDDGSTDGTGQWVESLGEKSRADVKKFDWMGRPLDCTDPDSFYIDFPKFRLTYVRKPNGGLYTAYNVAYALIKTELCVCVDSDDFMPDDAVKKIISLWRIHYPNGSVKSKLSALTSKEYCGILGLDFYFGKNTPIGGYLPEDMTETYRSDLFVKNIHHGDCKEVMRTELMRLVAPQIGFEGEKNFNPSYMLSQVWDKYPLLVINDNLCTVEYQIGADSMSQGIYRQYVNSPRSYAKHRILHMRLKRYPYSAKFKYAAHYISSCIISKDKNWLRNSPMKLTTLLAIPMGLCIFSLIKIKTWRQK